MIISVCEEATSSLRYSRTPDISYVKNLGPYNQLMVMETIGQTPPSPLSLFLALYFVPVSSYQAERGSMRIGQGGRWWKQGDCPDSSPLPSQVSDHNIRWPDNAVFTGRAGWPLSPSWLMCSTHSQLHSMAFNPRKTAFNTFHSSCAQSSQLILHYILLYAFLHASIPELLLGVLGFMSAQILFKKQNPKSYLLLHRAKP